MNAYNQDIERTLDRAREELGEADALLIAAGAGFGVDSGLPDFRGNEGFWNAYPPYKKSGLGFTSLANPHFFSADPPVAWGFYGHRQSLYRDTSPHKGFEMLRDFGDILPGKSFVFTSNVDGQFAKAGFKEDRIVECHGTIHHLQCSIPCNSSIWKAEESPAVDHGSMRAIGELPRCPSCGRVARPNILMFEDGAWLDSRTDAQEKRYYGWLRSLGRSSRLVILEFGAGTAVSSVRRMSETLVDRLGATLIRVNPREPQGPAGTLSLPMRSLDACEALLG